MTYAHDPSTTPVHLATVLAEALAAFRDLPDWEPALATCGDVAYQTTHETKGNLPGRGVVERSTRYIVTVYDHAPGTVGKGLVERQTITFHPATQTTTSRPMSCHFRVPANTTADDLHTAIAHAIAATATEY